MRTLTLRELNRATLARQLLLERARLPLVRVVERLAGMQSQWAPAPYVGLWTRVDGFRREQLERATLSGRVIRAVLMRGTIHLVSAADYGLFGAAVREPPWLRPEAAAIADGVHDAVREFGREPRTRAEVTEFLLREHGLDLRTAESLWYAVRTRGRLTHAPESGLWKAPRVTRYLTLPHEPAEPGPARVELVRRYLAAFGPASRADAAEWSGLRVRELEPAIDALEPLRRFRDESGRELLDLPRAPLPPADTPAPVRFLPKWDNVLLAHADRRRVISDEHRRGVVAKNGDVAATVLVDGFVAAIWSVERGRVVVEALAPLPRAARRDLADEAARLEAWLR